ncbi:hypothetical protein ABFS82_14G013800 [Erythranthe guttata]|uniref:SAGA-associated factor 11 n=1 Tax=Erythranthe guttata TaxID=4155 RepID=A0A022RZW4_ERYGU|nr:PREDICTED: SAGA-associated factor 11 [Erythranthe guttata]EYU45609.1 hypothetical protein MIMGU_mgv1a015241mg [Erythranthe guttata]EYU45610.1 hypothetical protein MIMGU_mgv1a015241mg [Erythranthe guttata]|eukprot:XP_012841265.1 PREDICTED: SAGA-associated factor 11 [Erythranthe guttata]
MSLPKVDDIHTNSELISEVFNQLLDSIIVDVASECHRITKLGLDRNLDEEEEELRLFAEARARSSDPSHSGESNSKYVVDMFGQTHPPIASEIFNCMNCGRSIMAGRFAPHLEKCMGKGRKARQKSTRAAQNQNSKGSTVSNRLSNGGSANAGHEYSNGTYEEA